MILFLLILKVKSKNFNNKNISFSNNKYYIK